MMVLIAETIYFNISTYLICCVYYRGLAEQDGDGIKLVIDDYPYATDALELWDAMQTYTSKYVNIVYKGSDQAVQSDTELQNWWNEIINEGHGDKKDEPWWPKLDSISNLANVLTTISWIGGPHHAAVNFGQYAYGAFTPNKPFQTRKLIPEKGTDEYKKLQANPEKYWLDSISTQVNSTLVMVVFELLSTHSTDEEYIGQRLEDNWTSDPEVALDFH
jgi:linoleate 9S-lipoxygenase